MKHILILFALLLLTFAALHLPAQRNGLASNNWGSLPGDGSVWAFNGQYAAGWRQPMRNLLKVSGDISDATWTKTSATANSATLLTFTAQNGLVSQAVTTLASVQYTFSFNVRAVSGNTALHFLHTNSATGNSTALTATATLTRYRVTVLGRTGGGAVTFGLQDQNASGQGQVEVTEWQVTPGPSTMPYQRTGTGQTVADLSGTSPMTLGSNATAADTKDPSVSVYSRNRLAAGSTQNLQGGWFLQNTSGGASIDSATGLTLGTSTSDYVYQQYTVTAGVQYKLSATVTVNSGSTSLYLRHIGAQQGSITSITATASPVRYVSTTITFASSGSVQFGIQAATTSGSNITVTNWQLEVGSSATPFTSPAGESRAVGLSFTTDDYVGGTVALPGDWTILAIVRPTAVSKGLLRNGTSSPNVSLDANGKVAFAGASTITSTTAPPQQMWSVVGMTLSGTTIAHWLNGQANGSGTSASGNAFTELLIGYDGIAYYEGQVALVAAYPYAWSPWMMAQYARNIAEQFCPQRGILCSLKQSMESSGLWWREGEWASIMAPPFMRPLGRIQ